MQQERRSSTGGFYRLRHNSLECRCRMLLIPRCGSASTWVTRDLDTGAGWLTDTLLHISLGISILLTFVSSFP